ncbi:MAG: hypothetical protein QOJ38_1304, partial [Solirubrobacterales bacterium]|nr:hypothetical protein [Solirubrobacterales bacterium]
MRGGEEAIAKTSSTGQTRVLDVAAVEVAGRVAPVPAPRHRRA